VICPRLGAMMATGIEMEITTVFVYIGIRVAPLLSGVIFH
jgi:hypothetical protein